MTTHTPIIHQIRQTRTVFTQLVSSLDEKTLNEIPANFNNNIIWNYGHVYVTTPALVYQRSGIRPELEIPFQATFAKGSRPESPVSGEIIAQLQADMNASIDRIAQDLRNGLFQAGITAFSTSTYGAELRSIEDVLLTTLMHDNLHLGYAQAQYRALATM